MSEEEMEEEESEEEDMEIEEEEDEDGEDDDDEEMEEEEVTEEEEARRWHQLNLWGKEGGLYNSGGLRDLTPGHVDLAASASNYYRRYKEEERRSKFGFMVWRKMAGERWREAMIKADNDMRYNLDRAIVHWKVALAKAEVARDTVGGRSIARNLLVAYSRLVARIWPSLRLPIYREGVTVFATALKLSGEDKHLLKSVGERKGVVEVFEGLVESLGAELSPLATSPQGLVLVATTMCQPLDRWNEAVENTDAMGLLKLRIGEVIFNRAAMAVADRKFLVAKYLLKELYKVVEDAKSFCKGNIEMSREAEMLGIEAETHLQIADAIHQLHLADNLLDEAVQGSETLNMIKIEDCMDTYRRAAALVASQDVEVVCIAYTKIAKIRLKVMKDGISKIRGKEYLAEVMTLSQILGQDKNLHTMEWFNLATSLLREIQEEAQKKEDAEWNNKRKVVLEEVKEELAKLEEHEKDKDDDLVKFLFEQMPPKHRPEEEWRPLAEESEEKDWKKVMRKLVTVYHPDRVDKEKHGDKYYVLCEKVCQELTKRYECYKG